MNWSIAIQVAKFVIWLLLNLKQLVLEAEHQLPEAGQGSSKFAAVREAIIIAAKVAGMADQAIDSVWNTMNIDKRIDETVAKEVNGGAA